MFIIHINPVGVEEVILDTQKTCDDWQDIHLAVWPIIRFHLKRLDRSLKKTAYEMIKKEIPRPRTLLTGMKIGGEA